MAPGTADISGDITHSIRSNAGYAIPSSATASCGWNFIVLMSRQGKIRLTEFFSSYSESEKRRILRDIAADVLPRPPKMCNIIEKGSYKLVYRRYASLFFVVGVPVGMNELIVLEQIHLFVEALDGYFNSGTCEQNYK
jgi:AP-1 complex subunit sigma 1/2